MGFRLAFNQYGGLYRSRKTPIDLEIVLVDALTSIGTTSAPVWIRKSISAVLSERQKYGRNPPLSN